MRIRARELGGCPLGGTAGKRIGVGRAGQLHITSMLPAPLTSLAPTYMARSECGPEATCSVFSKQEVYCVSVVGHVGNI
jgi:hypothetical protein